MFALLGLYLMIAFFGFFIIWIPVSELFIWLAKRSETNKPYKKSKIELLSDDEWLAHINKIKIN